MFNFENQSPDDDRAFTRRRIRTVIIGAIVALVAGFLLVNLFTYFQYGGTMFDRFLEKKDEKKSAAAGKLAFDKGTKYYIGIIRGEGRSSRLGKVYYVEQAGGTMIEVAKENVEVRDPEKVDK